MSVDQTLVQTNKITLRDVLIALALACLIILPGLWTYTLIDPWEGHYAEVARRILLDDDWVGLHWR